VRFSSLVLPTPLLRTGWPCLVFFLLGLLLTASLSTAAERAPAPKATRRVERPVRLGLHHPRPKMCRDDDPAQRDLRVLRMAYRVGRTDQEWRQGPWYFARTPLTQGSENMEPSPQLRISVRERLLWGDPPGIAPAGEEGIWDGLAPWWLQLAGTLLAPWESPAHPQEGGWRVSGGDPLLGSRLTSTRLFPERQLWARECRDWPQGVSYQTLEAPRSYRMTYSLPGEPAWELTGFSTSREAWSALRDGQLDGLLVEDSDLGSAPRWSRQGGGVRWGRQPGGQQVVLKFLGQGWEALTPQARLALSLAMPRAELSGLESPAALIPAEDFLAPLVISGAPAESLAGDALHARTLWLQEEPPLKSFSLNVLSHPFLNRLGQGIAARWRRSLNLDVTEVVRKPAHFAALSSSETPVVILEVVDLEDGSLQDLWRESLGPEGLALFASNPRAAEERLRSELPYLPVFQQVHHVVVPGWAPEEMLGRVCPGCRPVPPPNPLEAPPEEGAEPTREG